MVNTPNDTKQPGSTPAAVVQPETPAMHPGDQAPPGTPGTGENICRDCEGTGKLRGQPCPTCGGTGRVVEGVGGA